MRRLLAALVLSALCAPSCGGAAGGSGDPSPTIGPSVVVTLAQDRQSITAHVGDHVQIALGDQYNWRLDPPDGVVLARPTVENYLLVRGTQAIWLARAAGQSTIRATGTPICPSGSACAQFVILFSATVVVTP